MSYANSTIPTSAQQGVHERLDALVQKHLQEAFRKPILDYNRAALLRATEGWDGQAPVILDSCCGVGHSSIQLARAYPDHWVIGVDQSEERLSRRKPYPERLMPQNLVFVRADVVDFWRLLPEAGVRLARHYLLYPNPWPKIGHIGRRWHAHPVFPYVRALGGVFECRSNWSVYIEELARALCLLTGDAQVWASFEAEVPLTPFERKYRDSGQTLYRLQYSFAAHDACDGKLLGAS